MPIPSLSSIGYGTKPAWEATFKALQPPPPSCCPLCLLRSTTWPAVGASFCGACSILSTETTMACSSAQDISKMLRTLGLSQDEEAIRSLLVGVGTTLTGLIDEHEFCLFYYSVCSIPATTLNASFAATDDEDSYLLEAFRVFDKDGDGFISPAELQSVLCSLGFAQASQLEECVQMIARVDENADGQVDFFEFKRLFDLESGWRLIAAS